jgi:uncharacterized protein (TIGR03663 family)
MGMSNFKEAIAAGGALRMVVISLLLAAFVVAGILLRVGDLGERPLHADEATGARIVGDRLEQSDYQFDPTHYHGPLLTAVAAVWSDWSGQRDWRSLEIATLRQVVAWSGVAVVLLAAVFIGRGWQRLVAMALVSTSPFLIYYSRMFIHEPLLVLFGALSLSGLLFCLGTNPRRGWAALLFGLGVGGMAATRETFVVSLFAWSLAGLLWVWREHGLHRKAIRQGARSWLAPALGAAGFTGLIIFWSYSSGGSHPAGVIDFFRTYFVYETVAGHEKPWWFFWEILVWPKHEAGRWWTEGGMLVLALTLYLPALGRNALVLRSRFFLEAGVLHLVVYSMISYKTPWLAMLGWFHVVLACAGALLLWAGRQPLGCRLGAGVLLLTLLSFHYRQAENGVGRLASDARNPYAYVPTSRDIESIAPLVIELQSLSEVSRPVAVIGSQYWPLPWYLRECGPVGYWPEWNPDLANWPLIIVLPTAPAAFQALESSHVLLPKGLRHEFPAAIAVEKALWDRYLNQPKP